MPLRQPEVPQPFNIADVVGGESFARDALNFRNNGLGELVRAIQD